MRDGKLLITGDFDIPPDLVSDQLVHLRVPLNDQNIIEHLQGATQYIIGGPEYLDDRIMTYASDLRHVVVMGTGTNSFVDMAAAASRGIAVDNTPGINADAVAEFALGLVISNLANCFLSHNDLLNGGWYQKPHKTLSESRVGIIGLGDIGARLAQKIHAVSGAEVSYFSRTRKPDLENEHGLTFMDAAGLMQTSDAVILCLTYTPDTHKMVNAELLSHAKDGMALLNFSNPLVIDPVALKDGLISGKPQFAYFDGYYNEWVKNTGQKNDEHGLLGLGPDKFVATSHIAAQSHAVIGKILKQAFEKLSVRAERNDASVPHRHEPNPPPKGGQQPIPN